MNRTVYAEDQDLVTEYLSGAPCRRRRFHLRFLRLTSSWLYLLSSCFSLGTCRAAPASLREPPAEGGSGLQRDSPTWLPGQRRGWRTDQTQEAGKSSEVLQKPPGASSWTTKQLQTVRRVRFETLGSHLFSAITHSLVRKPSCGR